MKTNRIPDNTSNALEILQQALAEKSGLQIRIEGVIRRLLDTDVPEEQLVSDEIKATVRVIFSHLKFTDGDLNEYISEAKKSLSKNRKVGVGWIGVNMSKMAIREMKNLARSADMTFRLFCELSLRNAAFELCERFGLTSSAALRMDDDKIAALKERSRLLRQIRGPGDPESN